MIPEICFAPIEMAKLVQEGLSNDLNGVRPSCGRAFARQEDENGAKGMNFSP